MAEKDPLTFEKALEELESIVARMEEGKLTDAQARIAILEGGELREFNPEK